jgi:hypothetical protein
MKVTKNKTLIIVFIAVYYLFYLTATINQSDFWGNILSPIGALISFFLLLQAYYKSSQPKYVRYIWLFFLLLPFLGQSVTSCGTILFGYLELIQ